MGLDHRPIGFRITLNRIYDRYHKPIFISENGLGAVDHFDEKGQIQDDYRIDYMRAHVEQLRERSQMAWTCSATHGGPST